MLLVELQYQRTRARAKRTCCAYSRTSAEIPVSKYHYGLNLTVDFTNLIALFQRGHSPCEGLGL
jgi:hypothetical protein